MNTLKYLKRLVLVAIAAFAIVLVVSAPSQAREAAGHGFERGHSSMGQEHRGFEGNHGFDGHRNFDRDGHGRFFFGPTYPYYGYYPPAYGYEAPTYWYCPSYGTYYPTVGSCPEAWVPVS